jgi:cytochrome P450
MLHNEEVFPNSNEFKPERFIGANGAIRTDLPDPEYLATFGWGRRFVLSDHHIFVAHTLP